MKANYCSVGLSKKGWSFFGRKAGETSKLVNCCVLLPSLICLVCSPPSGEPAVQEGHKGSLEGFFCWCSRGFLLFCFKTVNKR